MEIDDLVKHLEWLHDLWIEKSNGPWGYKHGQAEGIRVCAENIKDCLDVVRQTKKG